MSKSYIILIGGGGHCKSCIDVIEQSGMYQIKGIIDVAEKAGSRILGYPVIGTDDDIIEFKNETSNFIITLGQIGLPGLRKVLYHKLKELELTLPVVISPLAYVSKHARIGEGSIVMHHAIINAGVKIGRNNIINSKALIEHDVEVGDHCHISTGSIVNGGVKIGDGTFYGSGAVSKEYIVIPPGSFIKANSIVK